jgi:hypothetical protein
MKGAVNMNRIHVQAEGMVNAPAAAVYALLADYRNGHPLVIPREYFSELTVEQGGYGAGTVISFSVKTGGSTRQYREVVTEPQPGRVLVESDTLSRTVTSFTVTPQGDNQCQVEIATTTDTSTGIRGFFEKLIAPAMMKRIYEKELQQISAVASAQLSSKTV